MTLTRNAIDAVQRASIVSCSTRDKDDNYIAMKTPVDDLEGGALRAGGAPRLLSRENIGVLFHYCAVGVMLSTMPATIYPFLQVYLNVDGKTHLTAETLVVLPWSFKLFYGVLSDCVPILGFRRRPYMVIGWTMCICMLLVMASLPVGDPYWSEPEYAFLNPIKQPEEYAAAVAKANTSAPSKGSKYVMLMMLAAVGYLMANVCADGLVVELAQREPIAVRGTTQTVVYGVRTLFSMFGQLLVGFLFNGKEYGGHFDFSVSFPMLMLIIAVVLSPIIPVVWFFITEEKAPRANFRAYLSELWRLIQTRAMYQVIFYFFFSGVLSHITWVAASPVKRFLIKVTPINNTIAGVFSSFMFMVGIAITGQYGLHWNWRWITVITGLVVIVIDAIVTFVSVWDVFRSQWFWLGIPLTIQVPEGIAFVISTYVIVELAGEGNEGAIYGLLTTVANCSRPFAATLTRIINNSFDFSNKRIQGDSNAVRWDITYAVLVMYASSVASWLFLYFLPAQKEQTQELRRNGGSSKILGGITVAYVAFALIWSVMVNIMGIYKSTSCLVIAGGSGC